MRLIDADALMKTLGITDMDCEKCDWGDCGFCKRGSDFRDACVAIEDSPTIEERKRGKWINHIEKGMCECQKCGEMIETERAYRANYCPNCGADMRGES